METEETRFTPEQLKLIEAELNKIFSINFTINSKTSETYIINGEPLYLRQVTPEDITCEPVYDLVVGHWRMCNGFFGRYPQPHFDDMETISGNALRNEKFISMVLGSAPQTS